MTDHQNITILYVDDEDVNLFLFKANFKSKFNVITSISPIEALSELDAHHDDIIVVISDMRMPIMNGIEFIKKAKEKYDDIYYYILTGFDYNDEIEDALTNNVIQKFFTKPFNTEEIEQAVYEAVKNIKR